MHTFHKSQTGKSVPLLPPITITSSTTKQQLENEVLKRLKPDDKATIRPKLVHSNSQHTLLAKLNSLDINKLFKMDDLNSSINQQSVALSSTFSPLNSVHNESLMKYVRRFDETNLKLEVENSFFISESIYEKINLIVNKKQPEKVIKENANSDKNKIESIKPVIKNDFETTTLNNRYVRIKKLATGAFGQTNVVYLRNNKKRYFALKLVDLSHIDKLRDFLKLDDYLKWLKKLSHNSNLTRINELFCCQNFRFVYFISDYVNSMYELVNLHKSERTSIDPNMILKWFEQAIAAIAYLHETCHILHGNIKPQNFLLTSNENLKVSDYGYSNLFRTHASYVKHLLNSRENLAYLPRETIDLFEYDEMSEIYAIGRVFCELTLLKNFDFALNESQKSDLKNKLKECNIFSSVLVSMQNVVNVNRPSTNTLKQYCEWVNTGFLIKQTKQKGSSLSTMISVLRDKPHLLINIKLDELAHASIDKLVDMVQRLLQVEHKNLLTLNDYLLIDKELYLVYEYLNCVTLREKLGKMEKVKDELVIEWSIQIASALDFLHSKQIAHQKNLNCESILISDENEIKLSDFGVHSYVTCLTNQAICTNSKMSTTHSFGLLLLELITLRENESNDYLLGELLNELETKVPSKTIKVYGEKRAELLQLTERILRLKYSKISSIQNELKRLMNITKYTLLTQLPNTIELNSKIVQIVCLSDNELLINTLNKSKNIIEMNKLEFFASNKNQFKYSLEKMHTSLIRTKPQFDYFDTICSLNNKCLLVCNSKSIYIYDKNFKCLKRMSLIDALEMRNQNSSNEAALTATSNNTHSNLLNNLKLKVKCLYYSLKTRRLYLLLSIHDQHCLVSTFDVDISCRETGRLKEGDDRESVQLQHFELTFKNSFHMNIHPNSIKSFVCSSERLFACCLDNKLNKFIRVFDLNDAQSSFVLGTTNEIAKDVCIDSDERVWIAFEHSLQMCNKNGELLWTFRLAHLKFDFSSFKLANICFSPMSSSVFILLKDEQNECKNKLLIYSNQSN
jgi:serine/threonine protein kinase